MLKNKNIILLAVTIGVFLEIFDSSITNISMFQFHKIFNAELSVVQLISSLYLMGLGIFTPISIFVSKKYSIRNALILGFSIFGIGTIACSLSNNIYILIISRILQSFGASFMLPVSRMFLRYYFKDNLLNVAAKTALVFLIAYAIGPFIGGYILENYPWQIIFLINLPPLLICLTLVFKYLPQEFNNNLIKFDYIGYFIYALIIILFMNLSLNYYLFILLFILIVYFNYYINRNKNTILSIELFKNRNYISIVLSSFFARAAIVQFLFIVPLLLQQEFLVGISKSAWIVATYAPGAMLSRLILVKYKITNLGLLLWSLLFILFVTLELYLFYPKLFINIIYLIFFMFGLLSSLIFANFNAKSLLFLMDNQIEEGSVFYSSILQIGASFGFIVITLISPYNKYIYEYILELIMFMTIISLLSLKLHKFKFLSMNRSSTSSNIC